MSKTILEGATDTTFLVHDAWKGASAVVTTTGSTNVPRPTAPGVKHQGNELIELWGDDNDFPQKVIEDVRNDTEIGTMLDQQARLLYSGGIIYGTIEEGENGSEVMKPLQKNDKLTVSQFIRKSNINAYILEASKDMYWFYNVFPEIVLSMDRSQIVQICVQAAEECRWARQNSSTGLVDFCYINANWPDAKADDKLSKKVPVLDPYYDAAGNLALRNDGTNYIYPLSYPTPGNKFYQLADWNSIRSSGWLDVSKSIPKWKKQLLKNSLNIKYHIEVSNEYWSMKYPGFEKLDATQRVKIQKEEIDSFMSTLKGDENNGKPFFSSFRSDPNTGKDYPAWKINVIDQKMQDKLFVEDLKQASDHKASAIGLHPALRGTTPNSGMGGAGSNIREAYNLHILTNRPQQDLILAPLYLARDYNKWNPEIEFRFKNSFMQTLDKGKETKTTAG